MSVRAPAESSLRRLDGGWLLALASVVTPSSSLTTVSYWSRVMRGTWVVAGTPGMQTHVPTQAGGWITPVPPRPVEPAMPVTTTMLPAPVVPAPPVVPVVPATPGVPVLPELPVGCPVPTLPVQAAVATTNNPTRVLPMERVMLILPFCRRRSEIEV